VKFHCGGPIEPERKRCDETGTTTIERRRLNDFNAGDSGESSEFGGVVADAGEYHWYNFARAIAVQRGKQIALVVVTAGPQPARDIREGDTKRGLVNHGLEP
jgi:hypothetical protein